jgi:hypothetical protein
MEIKCIGKNSFSLVGKNESVLINPTDEQLKKYQGKSRIIIFSREDFLKKGINDSRVVIMGPGEYEVGGIEIKGYNSGDKSTIYSILVEGVEIGFLGDIQLALSDKRIDRISGLDVLLAPVDGKEIGDGKIVQGWAKKWGANYLIPFGYEKGDGKLEKFLDQLDQESLKPVDNIKINADTLPDGMEVVVLAC